MLTCSFFIFLKLFFLNIIGIVFTKPAHFTNLNLEWLYYLLVSVTVGIFFTMVFITHYDQKNELLLIVWFFSYTGILGMIGYIIHNYEIYPYRLAYYNTSIVEKKCLDKELKMEYLWLYVYVEILTKFYLTIILVITISFLTIIILGICYTGSESTRESVEV